MVTINPHNLLSADPPAPCPQVKLIYQPKVWEKISPRLYATFWSLTASDIIVPTARYYSLPPPPLLSIPLPFSSTPPLPYSLDTRQRLLNWRV